jgi:hypothetical protein
MTFLIIMNFFISTQLIINLKQLFFNLDQNLFFSLMEEMEIIFIFYISYANLCLVAMDVI